MIYTAYSEEKYNNLPKRYRKEVLGVASNGDILQLPLCPECGDEMMENEGYLSCMRCGATYRKRVLKE